MGSICVSRDHKWVVCGTPEGASVWDAGLRERVIDVEGAHQVWTVDVSPDSTRFATGTDDSGVSVWSIASGRRLVGPLEHDGEVSGVKFSPNGEHFASACWQNSEIRVFDSHNGDELIDITIETIALLRNPVAPLLWSNDGQRIFAASDDSKIKCFSVSTGSQLAESQILRDGDNDVQSIALATNGSFIATYSGRTIFFLDASTLTRIGPVIDISEDIASIALSPDNNHLATGRHDGKISVHYLGHILPDVHDPQVCIRPFITCAYRMCPILSPPFDTFS